MINIVCYVCEICYKERIIEMFDKLDDILVRFEEVLKELNDPSVVNDQQKFRKLMKEQNDLAPIVEAYKEYKQCKQDIEDSLMMLEEESDEEMRELAKEELNASLPLFKTQAFPLFIASAAASDVTFGRLS